MVTVWLCTTGDLVATLTLTELSRALGTAVVCAYISQVAFAAGGDRVAIAVSLASASGGGNMGVRVLLWDWKRNLVVGTSKMLPESVRTPAHSPPWRVRKD
jgi:hypothetical protein